MAAKQAFPKAKSGNVFGQRRKPAKMLRAGLYARVSTNDQQTIPLQIRDLREYAARRGWTIALQVKEVGSGASQTHRLHRRALAGVFPRERTRDLRGDQSKTGSSRSEEHTSELQSPMYLVGRL